MMIEVKQGDYGYNLDFTVQNNDGTAFDLTDYAVKLKVWKSDGTLLVNGACIIDDAVNGTCHYTVSSGDFDTLDNPQTSGTTQYSDYTAELELTKTDVVLSTPSFVIRVWESK